jgi:hypothetical protein
MGNRRPLEENLAMVDLAGGSLFTQIQLPISHLSPMPVAVLPVLKQPISPAELPERLNTRHGQLKDSIRIDGNNSRNIGHTPVRTGKHPADLVVRMVKYGSLLPMNFSKMTGCTRRHCDQ